MKWFAATNQSSLQNPIFFDQLKVAVTSLLLNTRLKPHLVYEGGEVAQLGWLKEKGVTILPHRLSFRDAVVDYVNAHSTSDMIDVRSGSFLKTEVPLAMRAAGIDDPYILYTDCDVIFLRDPQLERLRPAHLAACGRREGGRTRFHIGGWMHFNCGVLLMNVSRFADDVARLREFILENGNGAQRPNSAFMGKNLFMSDQVTLNLFYRGKIDRLDRTCNWHPTMGINQEAKIVHFNGLKFTQWKAFCDGTLPPQQMEKFTRLVQRNRPAFEHYVQVAQEYLRMAN